MQVYAYTDEVVDRLNGKFSSSSPMRAVDPSIASSPQPTPGASLPHP